MTDAYLGNPNLKKVNTPVEYSKEQIIEYEKCANDPIYFMEEYVRIVSLDEGLVPFKMYPFQKKIVETIHNIDLQYVNYQDNQVNQLQLFLTYFIMLYLTLIQISLYLPINHQLLEIY